MLATLPRLTQTNCVADSMGETALLHAMKDGYKDMVAWMLRLQGDRTNIELDDKQRLFPALVAARNGWTECLDVLIAKMTLGKADEDAKAALVKVRCCCCCFMRSCLRRCRVLTHHHEHCRFVAPCFERVCMLLVR
jgi:hypothetical protein